MIQKKEKKIEKIKNISFSKSKAIYNTMCNSIMHNNISNNIKQFCFRKILFI